MLKRMLGSTLPNNVHSTLVITTGLRTALRRCELGVELPIVADGSPRPKPEVRDRPLPGMGSYTDPHKNL